MHSRASYARPLSKTEREAYVATVARARIRVPTPRRPTPDLTVFFLLFPPHTRKKRTILIGFSGAKFKKKSLEDGVVVVEVADGEVAVARPGERDGRSERERAVARCAHLAHPPRLGVEERVPARGVLVQRDPVVTRVGHRLRRFVRKYQKAESRVVSFASLTA